MNSTDFENLALRVNKACTDLRTAKRAEYSGNADVLANFKRNAMKNGQTVFETWQTYWGKHIDSINTYMARVKDKALAMAVHEITLQYDVKSMTVDDLAKVTSGGKFNELISRFLPDALTLVDAELSEPIEGRFHDNMNYSILCLAILEEMRRG